MIVADNTQTANAQEDYKDFLAYVGDPNRPFKTSTLPFSRGLEMSVYSPWSESITSRRSVYRCHI